MDIAARRESARHPLQVRIKARELFLRGLSFGEIKAALAKGDADHPPHDVSISVVHFWAKSGDWSVRREKMLRDVERDQLRRIRREFSNQLSGSFRLLADLDEMVRANLLTQETDSSGNPVISPDGKPKMKLKTPTELDRSSEMTRVCLGGMVQG